MTPGSMTLACLLLAANAAEPPDTSYMNSTRFSIPISIKPERRAEIAALELWMSHDHGQSWQQHARSTPDKDYFHVTMLDGDGPYWFTVVVAFADGRRDPVDLKNAPVGQRVYVDTTRPEVKLTAERQGDEVVVAWEVREDNLDPRSLKIEWAQGNGLPVRAPMLNEPRGQTRIRPADPYGPVSVRMTVADLAENQGTAIVELPPVSSAPPGMSVGQYKPTDAAPRLPDNGAPPPPPPPSMTQTGPMRTVAMSTSGPGFGSAAPTPPEPVTTAAYNPQLPPVQVVNKRQVKIEFDVSKYGPTGLASAGEVYVTMDDGRTWVQSTVEAGAWSMPTSVNGVGPVHGAVTVQLNKEAAVYGFTVIVKSKALLGKPAPRPGDPPQLRVELDTTAPYAELKKTVPDPTQPDTMILTWTATDAHLAAAPITLEWAPERAGPWRLIGDPLMPNTGRYNWRITPDVPPNVYLRLTVRDSVGNMSVAETEKPETVDLSVPEVTGVGLQAGQR